MDTLFNETPPAPLDRITNPTEWIESVRRMVEPRGEEALVLLQMCLNAFSLARAFFCISASRKAYTQVEITDRLMYLGAIAVKFRSLYLRIGQYRLKCENCPTARAQSLRELESCYNWLKRNNLISWRIMSCQENGYDPNGHIQYEWVDLEPSEMVSKIFGIYDEAMKVRQSPRPVVQGEE